MQRLKISLKAKLKNAERIAVLGIGSDLRGDDAAGILIAQKLEQTFKGSFGKKELKVFLGFTAPENLTGEIKKFNPTHLIIIDSADLGKKPGEVKLLRPQDTGCVSFCTHQLPLKILTDYLGAFINCKVIIIGIQPKTLKFNSPLTKEVGEAVREICDILKGVIKK